MVERQNALSHHFKRTIESYEQNNFLKISLKSTTQYNIR